MRRCEFIAGLLLRNHQREEQPMSNFRQSKAMAILGLTLAIGTSAASGMGREERCSDATLTGEYAFGVTAYTPPGLPNGPPQVVTGIKVFDGNGHLTQRDFMGDSLRTRGQTEFSTGETGTYDVRPDCTGSMVISIPVPGLTTGTLSIEFVISNGGRHIHEVVSEFTPPGSPGPVPTQTSANDWKVGVDEDE
jgi:hypothetical protein